MTDDGSDALYRALSLAARATRPSDAAAAQFARRRALARLICLEHGCRETVAYVEVYVRDDHPVVRLVIRAPHAYESVDDPRVMNGTRIRLTGAIDGRRDRAMLEFADWSKGSQIAFVCRRGHESKFGAGELARRLRRVADVL